MEKLKNSRLLHTILIISLLAMGGLCTAYYWSNDDLMTLRMVPIHVMIYAVVYILLQIAKRYLYKEYNWWDWLYYIGLIAMMLPTLFANEQNLSVYNLFTDIGILFLIIPILFDGNRLIKNN